MDAGWMKEHIRFEETLKVGDVVELRWTNSGRYYQAKARLTKVNQASVRGELLEAVPTWLSKAGSYPAGQSIIVPRLTFGSMNRWSANNGVFSVKED